MWHSYNSVISSVMIWHEWLSEKQSDLDPVELLDMNTIGKTCQESVKSLLMFILDTLSRAYRLTTEDFKHDSSEVRALREVQHADGLSVSPTRLQELKRVTECDPEMQLLTSAIHKGWPLSRKDFPAKFAPYYDSGSRLVKDSTMVYRGDRLLVPPHLLRADMLKEIHRSHNGIGECLRIARELLSWPRIKVEVRDYVSKCSVCQTY